MMITEFLNKNTTEPKVLVENKISFNGPDSQLSIYDTFEPAQKVQLTQPTRCLAIEISKDRISQVADQLNYNQHKSKEFSDWQYQPQIVHTHHNEQTQALLQRMRHIYRENHQDRSFMIDLAVNELTIRLIRLQSRELMMSVCLQKPDFSGMTAAISYINTHLSESIDIDHLCRLACMSRTKFFNEFKYNLGCTPLAFQQQQRLKKAHNLIKSGQQITQVCFELGFTSCSHFSRVFKQFYGTSPKAFQKQ